MNLENPDIIGGSLLATVQQSLERRGRWVDSSQVMLIAGNNWPQAALRQLNSTGSLLIRRPLDTLGSTPQQKAQLVEAIEYLANHLLTSERTDQSDHVQLFVCGCTAPRDNGLWQRSLLRRMIDWNDHARSVRRHIADQVEAFANDRSFATLFEQQRLAVSGLIYAHEVESFLVLDPKRGEFVPVEAMTQ